MSFSTFVVILLFVLSLIPPIYIRYVAEAKADARLFLGREGDHKKVLFVHFAGYIGDGREQTRNVESVFYEKGDLLAIHYEGDPTTTKRSRKFDVDLVVAKSAAAIIDACKTYDYSHVVFIGTSMGAKMSYYTACFIRYLGYEFSMKAIIVDPPLSRQDFQAFLRVSSPFLVALPYIPVLNFLLLMVRPIEWLLVGKMLAPPPKPAEISEKLTPGERRNLEDSVKWAQGSRLTYMRGQVAAILEHVTPQPSPWAKGSVLLIRSGDDRETTVEATWESWTSLLGFRPHRLRIPGAKHCAYGQQAPMYRSAFRQAFKVLGI